MVDQTIKLSPYNLETGTYQVSYKVDGVGSSIEWSRQAYDMGTMEFGVTLASGLMKAGKDEYAEVSFKVDEATARAIEAQVSSRRGSAASWVSLPYRAKGYVLDTFKSENNRKHALLIMLERYELLNEETGEVIFTLDEKHLAPKFRLVTGDVPSVLSREISAKYDLE